jgi:vancomycin resistance protein VanJ
MADEPTGASRIRPSTGSLWRSCFRSRWDVLAVLPAALLAAAAIVAVVPPRSGPIALALVFEVQIFIAVGAVLALVGLLKRSRLLALSVVVTIVVGSLMFGSEWISLPGGAAGRHDFTVMSWNVQYGNRTPAEQAAQLEVVTADLVDLQEVEPDAAAAIENDAVLTARYPYRAMAPRRGAWGLAILSRYPISRVESTYPPACLDLAVATPHGTVHVIEAHPNHAVIDTRTPLRLPVGYDPAARDAEIAGVRVRVDAALAAGDRLLVLGDYNTAPSEPEYAVLSAGLRDTHVEVGEGPGWTWRPSRFTFLPFGFLRIDLQLTGGSIRPASTSIDCSLPGDHCRLFGDYEID